MSAGLLSLITVNPFDLTKINWLEAERFYVYDPSFPTLVEVAKKFCVSKVTINKQAHRRGWIAKREAALRQAHEKAIADLADSYENAVAQRLRRLTRLVDNAIDDAAIRPNEVSLSAVLRLLQIEREIVERLPPSHSRHRTLREQVERALKASGVSADQEGEGEAV